MPFEHGFWPTPLVIATLLFSFSIIFFLYLATGLSLVKQGYAAPASNIIRSLLQDKIMCYRIENTQSYISAAHLKRHFHCTERELGLLLFRVYCMVQKILSSNTNDIDNKDLR